MYSYIATIPFKMEMKKRFKLAELIHDNLVSPHAPKSNELLQAL